MLIYFAIFIAQLVSSFLSTSIVYFALKDSILKFNVITATNDFVKLTVISAIVVKLNTGDYFTLLAAVLGGIVGNTISFKTMKK